jgi:uncharacterized phage protein gp47/JayE
MPSSYTGFNKPSFTDLYNRIVSDINNSLPGQDASLPNTPLNILATATTGGFNELYSYLDYMSNQTNILYATGSNLDLYGQIWSVSRNAATTSTGTATFTGLAGYTLPSGTLVQTSTGTQYQTTSSVSLTTTSGTASLTALVTGNNNLTSGTTLSLVNPVSGINQTFTVVSLTGGSDVESDTSYRARLLDRIANPPFGGAAGDYINWMLSQPNVTRAWVYPLEQGPGTVVCRFAMDNTNVNGIPLSADVTNMQNYLNTLRPVTASVVVVAQYTQSINLTIASLFPNTTAVQTAVANELNALFTRVGSPGATIYLSWIWEAISLATGSQHHILTTPSADITLPTGAVPIIGTITYV